jgi:hypothetical protein
MQQKCLGNQQKILILSTPNLLNISEAITDLLDDGAITSGHGKFVARLYIVVSYEYADYQLTHSIIIIDRW